MRFSTLSDSEKETIKKLFLEGNKCHQISRIVKISDSTIRNYLIAEKLIVPRKREVCKFPRYKILTESDMDREMKTIIYK